MKKTLIFYLFFSLLSYAQTDDSYDILIAKASLLHLQKKNKEAVDYYKKAFKIKSPDALTAYKAAGVYSLEKNLDKAFYYLELSLQKGWTEIDWLLSDPYFDSLRKYRPEKWKMIEMESRQKEEKYSKSLLLPSLRKEINLMAVKDQQLRFKRSQTSNDSLLTVINNEINQSDLDHLTNSKKIIKEYGWPKQSQIGKDGQNNLWILVQHADQDIEFQKLALSAMEKLKDTKELNLENYAFLYDRVQCNLNYKQLYGTQVLWTSHGKAKGFRTIIKEYMVNKRRKKIGLSPLEVYSQMYGFDYKKLTKKDSEQKDLMHEKNVTELINKAKHAYGNKKFQEAYNKYNEASAFLGGMSNNDHFEAAIIFSKIASEDNDPKYKSIALDFLNLLYIRNFLSHTKLSQEKAFIILKNEPRWKEINK